MRTKRASHFKIQKHGESWAVLLVQDLNPGTAVEILKTDPDLKVLVDDCLLNSTFDRGDDMASERHEDAIDYIYGRKSTLEEEEDECVRCAGCDREVNLYDEEIYHKYTDLETKLHWICRGCVDAMQTPK